MFRNAKSSMLNRRQFCGTVFPCAYSDKKSAMTSRSAFVYVSQISALLIHRQMTSAHVSTVCWNARNGLGSFDSSLHSA